VLLHCNTPDGTFYTHAPTDMWELFHHHLSLATATSSPILCFMVAETIVGAITSIIGLVRDYVEVSTTNATASQQ
jgi:hypothetical protein